MAFLSDDILKGLEAARKKAARKGSRLAVHVGDEAYPILSLHEGGFSVDAALVPPLRGLVDIYDGPRHISHALIIAASDEGGRMNYEFKLETLVADHPIRDYAVEGFTHTGYLPQSL